MTIKFYIVGGYVRDRVLGLEANDHDFVVTGATPNDMLERGFIPIEAQSFPVFHHPVTRDEYALARKERKNGEGYHGFEVFADPSVTIEEDLFRRDLTCNAMAREVTGWTSEGFAQLSDDIIDPYGGIDDTKNGILRHVSEAYAEDPVRVLRTARFAARYNFNVAPETVELMRSLARSGELDHLTTERVWKELVGAIKTDYPTKFFWVLQSCEALEILFPTIKQSLIYSGWPLKRAALQNADTLVRFMLLFSRVPGKILTDTLTQMQVPSNIAKYVVKFNIILNVLERHRNTIWTPEEVLDALNSFDAFRQPSDVIFELAKALAFATDDSKVKSEMDLLLMAFKEAKKITFATLSPEQQAQLSGDKIGLAINQKRTEKIMEVML